MSKKRRSITADTGSSPMRARQQTRLAATVRVSGTRAEASRGVPTTPYREAMVSRVLWQAPILELHFCKHRQRIAPSPSSELL